MLPLNDTEPNRYSFFPIMTVLLIVVNTVMFGLEIFVVQGDGWDFFMKYALTPTLVLNVQGAGMLADVTSMFLHADPFHLFGNMLPLWVFGRRVEDACGPWRFLAFYFLAGTSANIFFTLVLSHSAIPGIGASGAIFGLMGAYLVLYPGGRIRTLVFLPFVPVWPRIRAIWIVLYFLGIQIVPAIRILSGKGEYTTNHWAHLGGFFTAVFILLFLRPEAYARYFSDTPV
ncbi:MAG TPA: rhomboid family intramembrane serine protease [Anaerolineales bacterium]|nr:rhomboid family intramembrane serine protease [Anaerolineales bacterium]